MLNYLFSLDCATYIVECVREKGSKFLLSKRPETGKQAAAVECGEQKCKVISFISKGLLAGLWEFPCMELENHDSTYEERKARASSFLKEKFGLIIENDEPSAIIRKDLGNVVHLFSHIRKVYHLEWIQVSTSIADTCVLSETTKWIDADELKDAPIPTALKKAIKIMEQHRSVRNRSFGIFINILIILCRASLLKNRKPASHLWQQRRAARALLHFLQLFPDDAYQCMFTSSINILIFPGC